MGRQMAQFDAKYYRRFYGNPTTRAASRADIAKLADFICAYTAYLGFRVTRVLDAGCGLGHTRESVQRFFPAAKWIGLEASEYMAHRQGFVHSTLEDYRARAPFDLIICNDVLQYADDRAARRALANLGRLSRGALYFRAMTTGDWKSIVDRKRSDGDVHHRPVEWYLGRLARHFRPLGGGLLARRGCEPLLWELERPWPPSGA
ncbi:MAG: hypothetical protein AMJ58_00975 [Gammaproteobacteria bacterium SG8_30]|jgi:SAM-dependent methyltransferase|nr:MAG: hypothetical protein AMJ58_00975 [Gammaproteobacteria bacterium SG8_30]